MRNPFMSERRRELMAANAVTPQLVDGTYGSNNVCIVTNGNTTELHGSFTTDAGAIVPMTKSVPVSSSITIAIVQTSNYNSFRYGIKINFSDGTSTSYTQKYETLPSFSWSVDSNKRISSIQFALVYNTTVTVQWQLTVDGNVIF